MPAEFYQHMKMIIPSPAINLKIAVHGKNVACVELVREMDQKSICQIDLSITILRLNPAHLDRRIRKTYRDQEFSRRHAV